MHELVDLLSDLYQDTNESMRVVDKAGFDTREIAFHDRAITNWFNILKEVKKHENKIDELVQIAGDENPDYKDRLLAAVNSDSQPVEQPRSPTVHGWVEAATRLDRTEQWIHLKDLVNTTQPALIMLHGTHEQNLELFITRMWKYLIDEIDLAHELIEVPKKIHLEIPDTVNGWEIRCREALQEEGAVIDLLVQKLRYGPVMLVIGRSPFSDRELNQKSMQAFQRFVTDRLSDIFSSLAQMPLAKHPLRVVFAVTYESDQSWSEQLHDALFKEFTGDGVRYSRLPQVRAVEWAHIENYLDRLTPSPNVNVHRILKDWFDALDTETLSFKDLAEQLDQQLH